jgi:hypothetical protein
VTSPGSPVVHLRSSTRRCLTPRGAGPRPGRPGVLC